MAARTGNLMSNRALCPVCKRMTHVRGDGCFRVHGTVQGNPDAVCQGSDTRPPKETLVPPPPLLTDHERLAIMHLTQFENLMPVIIAFGPTRQQDSREMVDKIHGLQHMIMAQAAARAYPDEFRLLGSVVGQ